VGISQYAYFRRIKEGLGWGKKGSILAEITGGPALH
jgi:hypothetical protein